MDIKFSTNQEKYQNVKSPELREKLVKALLPFALMSFKQLSTWLTDNQITPRTWVPTKLSFSI